MPDMQPFASRMDLYRARLQNYLDLQLPPPDQTPARLHQAMRYALLGEGKRLRPLLLYACGEVTGVSADQLDPAAAAIEAMHAYSLVHDDLPDMDDDDLRRGKPTVHLAFDPATAILTGDALQSWAFEQLTRAQPEICHSWLLLLATAGGSAGMCAGQCLDIENAGENPSLARLQQMHQLKTGALISASVMMAAACQPDLDQTTSDALQLYAEKTGLAFQIQDDLLDVEASSRQMGKRQGSDARQEKPTFASLLGIREARRQAELVCGQACDALHFLGDQAEPLLYLADCMVHRDS